MGKNTQSLIKQNQFSDFWRFSVNKISSAILSNSHKTKSVQQNSAELCQFSNSQQFSQNKKSSQKLTEQRQFSSFLYAFCTLFSIKVRTFLPPPVPYNSSEGRNSSEGNSSEGNSSEGNSSEGNSSEGNSSEGNSSEGPKVCNSSEGFSTSESSSVKIAYSSKKPRCWGTRTFSLSSVKIAYSSKKPRCSGAYTPYSAYLCSSGAYTLYSANLHCSGAYTPYSAHPPDLLSKAADVRLSIMSISPLRNDDFVRTPMSVYAKMRPFFAFSAISQGERQKAAISAKSGVEMPAIFGFSTFKIRNCRKYAFWLPKKTQSCYSSEILRKPERSVSKIAFLLKKWVLIS